MKTCSLLALTLLLTSLAQAQSAVQLASREVLGGRVSLLIPVDFHPMTQEGMLKKYSAARMPTEAYTNEKGSVNIALSHMASPLDSAQVESIHAAFEQQLKGAHPNAEWNHSGVIRAGGAPFLLFDLKTPLERGWVRNIMMVGSLDGRALIINFNAASYEAHEWSEPGKRIMESIRFL